MIRVNGLSFSYTRDPYIEDIHFEVKKGEVFGFLGPSGAGKSTLQKILTGVLSNYQGCVNVLNYEAKKAPASFYEEIGVDFEYPSLFEKLSAVENMSFFASLYERRRNIQELLQRVGLQYEAEKKVMHFSKGMKSRLNFIKALVHDPKLLFLDEPTSGLDPTNARVLKDMILEEKRKGKTIILTTHNMYDASELCDRVAFIVDGTIKALDSPRNLIMSRGAAQIIYTYKKGNCEIQGSTPLNETKKDPLLKRLLEENRITSIHSSEPTLNDIFLEITGRSLE